jgi:hypothetical protein
MKENRDKWEDMSKSMKESKFQELHAVFTPEGREILLLTVERKLCAREQRNL